jgi:hypothetical protein
MGVTYKAIRERAPRGYNLAMEVPLDYAVKDKEAVLRDFMSDKAVPVLVEATGALGILRAMDFPGKRPGILEVMALDGQEHRLLHLVIGPEKYSIHSYLFTVTKEE